MPWCFHFMSFSPQSVLVHCAYSLNSSGSAHLFNNTQKSIPNSSSQTRRLSAGAPDVLEVTVTLSEAVDAVVRLAHGADEAAESVGLGLASESAVLVDLGDADLDRAVVLGLDDAVGGAALAGDVTERLKICQPFCVWFFVCGLRVCVWCVWIS
jgi:hypothetical protein